MNIKTKFNIGDTVYTVIDCAIVSYEVGRIYVFVYEGKEPSISYQSNDCSHDVKESVLFSSKEELIHHLMDANNG